MATCGMCAGTSTWKASDKKLDADAVDYNDDTGDVEAWGNVRYENFLDGTKLNCDHATYNVNTETGIFYNVRGTSETKIVARPGLLTTNNPFYFEGKWGERTEGKYIIHEGFVTDCKVPKPWWRLTSHQIRYPSRQSRHHVSRRVSRQESADFLFPRLLQIAESAAAPERLPHAQHRAQLHLRRNVRPGLLLGHLPQLRCALSHSILHARGVPRTRLRFRGKVRPGTDFSFNVYAVQDRGINVGNGVIQKQGGEEFTFDGHSDLGDGWLPRVHLDELSSFLFREAFSQSFHETIFSETHSVGFVIKHWSSFAFDIVAARDEEYENATPSDTIIIKKLPVAEFLSRDRQILGGVLPVWFSLNSSAGFLDRTQPEFQTPRFVSRVDVYPEVTTAFHFADFNLTASAAIRETEYSDQLVERRESAITRAFCAAPAS